MFLSQFVSVNQPKALRIIRQPRPNSDNTEPDQIDSIIDEKSELVLLFLVYPQNKQISNTHSNIRIKNRNKMDAKLEKKDRCKNGHKDVLDKEKSSRDNLRSQSYQNKEV